MLLDLLNEKKNNYNDFRNFVNSMVHEIPEKCIYK